MVESNGATATRAPRDGEEHSQQAALILAPKDGSAAAKKRGAKPIIGTTRQVEVRPAQGKREAEVKTMTVAEHLCWLISTTGCPLATAAQVAGISERVIYKWIARGQKWLDENTDDAGDSEPVPEYEAPYVRFVHDIGVARGEQELFHLRNLTRHALTNPKVSQWYLERSRPDTYGRRTRHEVSGPEGAVIEHEVFVPPSDQWMREVTRVAAEAVAAQPRNDD